MSAPVSACFSFNVCKSVLRSKSVLLNRLTTSTYFKVRQANFCDKNPDDTISKETQGFLKAHQKIEDLLIAQQKADDAHADDNINLKVDHGKTNPNEKPKTFTELYRDSVMVRLGDFSHHLVTGKIVARVNENLYIDYGGKFNCVCRVPQATNNEKESGTAYQEGKEVIIKVKDHEMTAKFMGYDKDMTLLEADASLVGASHRNTRVLEKK